MNNLTGGELWRIRSELEATASSILGRLLFTFSRLDFNVSLLVSSIERVGGNETAAAKATQLSFHERLARLALFFEREATLPDDARAAYGEWLLAMQEVRTQRNQLVHGRWDIDPNNRVVLNIMGPTSSLEERTIPYTLAALQAAVSKIEQLQGNLAQLRKQWPI